MIFTWVCLWCACVRVCVCVCVCVCIHVSGEYLHVYLWGGVRGGGCLLMADIYVACV